LAKQQEKEKQPVSKTSTLGNDVLAYALAAILFLAPLVPDVKLTRPKLLLLETGLYGILFLWAFRSFYLSKISPRRSMVLLPAAAYVAASTVFYFLSPDKLVALSELKRSLLSFSAFLIAANIAGSARGQYIIITSWLSGALLSALYGILQHTGGVGIVLVPKFERVMSTFGNPIFFAAHLVAALPVALALMLSSKKSYIKLIVSLGIVCGLIALYQTQTRAAFIAFGISVLIFAWLNITSKKIKIISFVSLMVFSALFAFNTKNLWSRQQAHGLIWRDTLVMWSQNPWLGTGPGTFHIYFPKFASEELKNIWPQGEFIVNDAHNEYIQLLSETGIAGFGIFLWLIAAFIVKSLAKIKRARAPDKLMLSGHFSSAAGILVMNIFSVDMRFIISAVFLFILMGLMDSFGEEPAPALNLAPAARFAGMSAVALAGFFVFPAVLKPYIAQKNVAATPDFFDERVLEPAKTINDLEKIAQKYPGQALVYEKIAWVYSKEKNWQKAVENYTKAFELNPKSAGPLNNIGNIYFLTGNRPQAIEFWRRSLKVAPGQLDSRLNLATAYYYNGQLKEAVDELKEVLKADPKNEKAIVMLKQMTE